MTATTGTLKGGGDRSIPPADQPRVPQAHASRVAPCLVVRLNQGLKGRLALAVVGLVLAPLRRIGISGFLAGGPLPLGIGRLG